MALLKGYWRKLSQQRLMLLVGLVASFAVGFDGMAQGAMASVQAAPTYLTLMQLAGKDGVVTNATLQGGIVAIYYLGSTVGAFLAGHLADTYGRSKAVIMGAMWAILGCVLQVRLLNY
jgi:MFS family permease